MLDTKWCVHYSYIRCLAKSHEPSPHSGVLGIADATGCLNLMKLTTEDSQFHLSPWKVWQMNDEGALCLSLDWSDRGPNEMATDAKLILSQSNGTLCMVPSLNSESSLKDEMQVWRAHDYEAWIAAWDCWSNGNVVWRGMFAG